MFSSLLVLIDSLLILSCLSSEIPPEVSIEIHSNGEILRRSSESFIFSDNFDQIRLKCISPYPNVWRFPSNPSEDGYLIVQIATTRLAEDISDNTTFTYISDLILRLKNPIISQIIACQFSSRPYTKNKSLSTGVYLITNTSPAKVTTKLVVRIEKTSIPLYIFENKTPQYGGNLNCHLRLHIDKERRMYGCSISNSTTNPESDPRSNFSDEVQPRKISCSSDEECSDSCSNSTVDHCNHRNCRKIPGYKSGVLICEGQGTSVARAFFLTIENPPHIYSQRNEVNISQVLTINLKKQIVYEGEVFEASCAGAASYFSRGFRWGIQTQDGEIMPKDWKTEIYSRTDERHIMHTALCANSSTITAIGCYAPVSNSYKYENVFVPLNVLDVRLPKILDKPQLFSALTKFDVNVFLTCKAEGVPLPEIMWVHKGRKLDAMSVVVSDTVVESRLKLKVVVEEDAGQYLCTATSLSGCDAANFTVIVDHETGSRLSTIVIIPLIGLVSLFIFGLIIVKKLRNQNGLTRREIAKFKNGVHIKDENDGQALADCVPYNEKCYEIKESSVIVDTSKSLGEGAFGVVYLAILNGQKVAAKRLRPHMAKVQLLSLLSELKIMTYIGAHANIVSVIGAHTSQLHRGKLTVFVEYCELGSLYSYLKERRPIIPSDPNVYTYLDDANRITAIVAEASLIQKPSEVTTEDMKLWSFQISNGMEYLASKKVIHGDLATRNVLLMDKQNAKISDFGLARKLYQYTVYQKSDNQEPLPWGWMSVEALRSLKFSEKSDVWAFGVTLWEIFSFADVPYPGMSWSINFPDLLENNLRLQKPKPADEKFYSIMLTCWHTDPTKRPTFQELKRLLSG